MKQATAQFTHAGAVVVTTAEGTRHRFASVSRAVIWCRDNNVNPTFKN